MRRARMSGIGSKIGRLDQDATPRIFDTLRPKGTSSYFDLRGGPEVNME
eukprot:CAMPEP_0114668180 /NCGR_PEP_ID=MMETSP0191-20121206/35813_1 /TAXON_ID=126664 /ORGANISM="Sorites sp." /LENGTH=48 /DNA_ID= /DNA_START= /DNA_END= /DNA_ORIENTATION=